MNGDVDVSALVESQRRLSQKVDRWGEAVMDMDNKIGAIQTTVDEHARALKAVRSEIAVGFASIRSAPQGVHTLQSFTADEWADSPTGTHKIHKVKKAEFERWYRDHALDEDGKRLRIIKRWAWRGLLVVGAGAGTLLGEMLMRWFLHHA